MYKVLKSTYIHVRLNIDALLFIRCLMAHTLPKGYIVYNLDFIPDYVFEPFPAEIKPDSRNYLRLYDDTLIESIHDIDLRTDYNEFRLAPGKYFIDRSFTSGGFQTLYLKEPQKHTVSVVNLRESYMKYEFFRMYTNKYLIVFNNLSVIRDNTVTDEKAFYEVGLFGAESHDSIISRGKKHSYEPRDETLSEEQDVSEWSYRVCVFSSRIKEFINDPDVCKHLIWRTEANYLTEPPHAYINYYGKNYEVLRNVLSDKYDFTLKKGGGFITKQYRKLTQDEINKEIDEEWENIKKAERAGRITFVPIL